MNTSKPHLHAIQPQRYHETELVTLNTFTLPFGVTCKHCAYVLALVTDQVHFISDDKAQKVFSRQVAALQRAVNLDHAKAHRHWRFITDGVSIVPILTHGM
jgi:hypothetical protein